MVSKSNIVERSYFCYIYQELIVWVFLHIIYLFQVMNDRAQRALVRGQRREEAAAAQAQPQEVDLDAPAQDLDDIFKEREDIQARAPRVRGRAPAAAFPAAIDPGMGPSYRRCLQPSRK